MSVCAKGHPLVSKPGKSGFFRSSSTCHVCHATIGAEVAKYHCKACKYDICESCVLRIGRATLAGGSRQSAAATPQVSMQPAMGGRPMMGPPPAKPVMGHLATGNTWYYLDSKGEEVGPWAGETMLNWMQSGSFPVGERLLVRTPAMPKFYPVSSLRSTDLRSLFVYLQMRKPTASETERAPPAGGCMQSLPVPSPAPPTPVPALPAAPLPAPHVPSPPESTSSQPASFMVPTSQGLVSVACGSCPIVVHTEVNPSGPTSVTCTGCGRVGKLATHFYDMGAAAEDVPLPSCWSKDKDGQVQGGERTQVSDTIIAAVQEVINQTWKDTTTRDRGFKEVPKFNVVQVLRNENPRLWRIYQRRLAEMKQDIHLTEQETVQFKTSGFSDALLQAGVFGQYPGLDPSVNEGFLFHGTRPSAADAICKEDFRVNLAGSHTGTLYGPGIYLAESSTKMDEYAGDDADGLYRGLFATLICRVVCGRCLYTDEKTPDAAAITRNCTQPGAYYHSVLGDREKTRGTYREFVLFSNAQVFPEYIVIYRRLAPTNNE